MPLEQRPNIPQITVKRQTTIISSSGLWDPGDSQVLPELFDVRLPLCPFLGPTGAKAGGKLQRYRHPSSDPNWHTQRADSAGHKQINTDSSTLYKHREGMNNAHMSMDNTNDPILFLFSD